MLRQNSVDASELPFHIRDLIYSRWWTAEPESATPTLIHFTFGGAESTSLPPGFSALTETSSGLMDAVRLAFGEWEKVANLRFVEVAPDCSDDSVPLIRIFTHDRALDVTDTPEPGAWVSEIHFSPYANEHPDQAIVRHLFLHEIGHALGLWHPTGYDTAFGEAAGFDPSGNTAYTIMAYTPDFYTGLPNAATPGPYDVAAIQFLYGPNRSWNSGDTVYQALPGEGGLHTIWDTGGRDVLDCSRIGAAGTIHSFLSSGALQHVNQISLLDGTFSEVGDWHFAIYDGVLIEDAIGSAAADEIHDNPLDNRLYGMGGNDRIFLSAGNDSVDGGSGLDTVILPGPAADYRVEGDCGRYAIDGDGVQVQLSNVERLQFADATITLESCDNLVYPPTAGDDTVIGTAQGDDIDPGPGNDVVFAGAGDDIVSDDCGDGTLCAGPGNDRVTAGEGNDTLFGGEGNDTLAPGNGDNAVAAGEGDDAIVAGCGSDTIDGEAGNDVIAAGAGDDFLLGGPGADSLFGGEGNDILDGGAGSDVYVGGPGADLFVVTPMQQPVTVIADYEAGDHLALHWAQRGQVLEDPAQGLTALYLGAVNGIDRWILLLGQPHLEPADIFLV